MKVGESDYISVLPAMILGNIGQYWAMILGNFILVLPAMTLGSTGAGIQEKEPTLRPGMPGDIGLSWTDGRGG